jgi:hypothetical protein
MITVQPAARNEAINVLCSIFEVFVEAHPITLRTPLQDHCQYSWK